MAIKLFIRGRSAITFRTRESAEKYLASQHPATQAEAEIRITREHRPAVSPASSGQPETSGDRGDPQ